MKHHTYLFFNLFILISSLFLSACGSSSSGSGAVNTDTHRPHFFREKATSSASYSPSGETTDTTPTFSWKAINNATDYQIGHEGTEDASAWHEYDTSPSEAGCEQVDSTCTLMPSDYTFPLNVEKVWWVRAKVNGDWQDWSNPIIFTVVSGGGTNADIPTPISPINNALVNDFNFTWSKVAGASTYKIGLENAETGENWQEYTLSCNQSAAQNCTDSITSSDFASGQNIAWWMKAKVNGEWGEWSDTATFTLSSNNNTIPNIIGPTGVINSIFPTFQWSSVLASEYRIAAEYVDTGKNYRVLNTFSAKSANCLTGSVCTYSPRHSIFRGRNVSGKNVTWWVQAKINGEWKDWSDAGYISIQFSPVDNISDEAYKALCHGIASPNSGSSSGVGNLKDKVIVGEKQYFIDPSDDHTINISNLDGTDEHSVATFNTSYLKAISNNGALFVSVRGKATLIRENASPQHITNCPLSRCRTHGFTYFNDYTFYSPFYRRGPNTPPFHALVRVSSTGDSIYLFNSDTSKGNFYSIFYSKNEGDIYFSAIRNGIRKIGQIDDDGEVEYLSSCQ